MATAGSGKGGSSPKDPKLERQQKQEAELHNARAAIDRVFGLLGVKDVIVVDDEVRVGAEFSDLVKQLTKIKQENPLRLNQLKELNGVDLRGSLEEIRDDLESAWEKLLPEEQDTLLTKMGWTPGRRTFELLRTLLGSYTLKFLSLAEWREQEAALIAPESLAVSLLLFDLDMSRENGASDEGMKIIGSLLRKVGGQCHCGLLSHRVSKDEEYSDWQQYVTEYNLGEHQGRFVVISKKHLPESPMVFAQRLKRAAISSACDQLRGEVERVLGDAVANATGKLSDLNVYDFEEIVFQSSYIEGVWEPDTLLRIFALHTQSAARSLLKSNGVVESLASRIRSVVDIGYRPVDAPAPSSREIMWAENYEPGEFLAQHHIPLELGDIFRSTDRGGELVLLAQPCDLMCRNGDKSKRISEALVAPIISRSRGDETLDREAAYWKLEKYSKDGETEKYVDFHGVRAVPILALDLTVFHGEGRAYFHAEASCPANIVPSWRTRYEVIGAEISGLLKRLASAVDGIIDANASGTMQLINHALTSSVPGLLTGTLDLRSASLAYDVQRVARVKSPRAGALLRAFTAYLSRDGFDHDLTKTMAEEAKRN